MRGALRVLAAAATAASVASQCSGLSSCSSCATENNCVWCVAPSNQSGVGQCGFTNTSCAPGEAAFLYPNICPTTSNCSSYSNCTSCAETPICVWLSPSAVTSPAAGCVDELVIPPSGWSTFPLPNTCFGPPDCSQFTTCSSCISSSAFQACLWSQAPGAAAAQAGACVNNSAPFAVEPATNVAYAYCPPGNQACEALDSPSCTASQYCDWIYPVSYSGDERCQNGFCVTVGETQTSSFYGSAYLTGFTCAAAARGLSAAVIGVIAAAALLLLLTLLSLFVCRAFCVDVILFSCMPAWLYRFTGGCKRKNLASGEPMRLPVVHQVGV